MKGMIDLRKMETKIALAEMTSGSNRPDAQGSRSAEPPQPKKPKTTRSQSRSASRTSAPGRSAGSARPTSGKQQAKSRREVESEVESEDEEKMTSDGSGKSDDDTSNVRKMGYVGKRFQGFLSRRHMQWAALPVQALEEALTIDDAEVTQFC